MSVARLNSLVKIPSLTFKTLRVSSSSSSSVLSSTHRSGINCKQTTIQNNNRCSFLTKSSSFHTSSSFLRNENKKEESKKQEDEKEENNEEQEEVSEVEKKIRQLQKELEETKSKLQYSYAERENLRRMNGIDVQKAKDFGIQTFAKSLLDSADNFTRCLNGIKKEEAESHPSFKSFYEGVEMTEKILLKAFKSNGLEKFEPNDSKFDPNTMNALMYMPNPSKQNGNVGMVLKPGYILNGRVIRAADVGVVKNPEPTTTTTTNSESSP